MFTDQTKAAPDANPKAPGAPSPEQLEHLLVLSQAPLSLDEALAQEAAEDAAPTEPQPMTVARLAIQYVQILAHFVGVGLVAAAVRHLSSDPTLYLGLGAAGVVLFAAAATTMDAGARRGGLRAIGSFAGASVLLGLGLGLFVGGILHFSAFPTHRRRTRARRHGAVVRRPRAPQRPRTPRPRHALTRHHHDRHRRLGRHRTRRRRQEARPSTARSTRPHGETARRRPRRRRHGEAAGDASHGEAAASDHGETAAKDEPPTATQPPATVRRPPTTATPQQRPTRATTVPPPPATARRRPGQG